MSDYQGNIITKSPATPTGPTTTGRAPGMWTLSEAAYWTRQGLWPNASIIPDQYFPYVSLLLSTTSLGNANNNLFVDSSGAFNPVSRNGNTTQGSFTPYSTNWSNFFDGTSDSLTYTGGSSLNFGTSDFTIELWAFLTNTGTFSPFIRPDDSGSFPEFGYDFSSGQLKFDARNAPIVAVTTTMPTNQWVHVAASRSGTSLRLFVNGTQVGSTTTNSTNFGSTTGTIRIGGSSFSASHTVNGYLSNFRVLNGTALYTSNFTPPTAPLTAISGTSLLTCQSNRFRDASSNNFTITVNGNTSVQDFGPFNPAYPGASYNQSDITNWSGYFDGTSDWLATPNNAAFGFGTGDFTIECWAYPTSTKANMRLWQFSGDSDNIDISASGSTGAISYYNGSSSTVSSSGVITFNAWNHIACVRSSGTVRVYVNGVLQVTQATTPNSSARILYIAGQPNSWFQGYISNFRVVKGTAVYTSAFTPPTSALTAISGTSLLTLQNAAFTDNSTNNFILTPNGEVTVTGNSPFNTVGYWSVLFNGSSNWLAASANTATTLGTGNFTIEGWFFTTTNAANQVIIEQAVIDEGTGNNSGWLLYLNTSGNVVFGGAGGQTYINAAPSTSYLGQWTHFALVRTSTTSITLYINGVSIGSTSTNVNMSAALDVRADTPTLMGSHELQLAGSFFNGYLSNIRIVKGTAVYTGNFTPPTSPLTAISGTGLLTLQSSRLVDNSGNNITVASTFSSYSGGSPAIQPFDPFYTSTIASNGGSMYFDGSGDYLAVPNSANLQFGTSNFTVECWFNSNVTTAATHSTVIGKWGTSFNTTGDWALRSRFSNSNQAAVTLRYASGWYDITTGVSVNDGAWHHLAFVRENSTTLKVYVDGVVRATRTISASDIVGSSATLSIGGPAASASGEGAITGYVSNARITTGTALYTAAFTPPTSVLTPSANTTLLINGMNAGAYDATTINDMETVGNAQVSTVQSKFGGSSVYFDGSSDWLYIPDSPSLRFAGSFTVEFWINFSDVRFNNVMIAGSSGNTQMYILTKSNYTGLRFGLTNGSEFATGSQTWVGGTWYHVALVRNGTDIRFYVNGVNVTDGTPAANSTVFSGAMNIGDNNTLFGVTAFNGYIDDLRITNGVARYTSNFTPPTQAFPTF